ncbi:hypothetical protein CBR_g23117 [Chara braunii]|uniref:Integrase catalytic domain-containing protein n=1 Tax=Chara braunii TaxID=69332 RepID=A0A388L3X2_CHABU|nr:hypothetical protein CBR_g23117 [Chara braunii]|eukprot:GBG76903.1 hypothetical protein CBR_g23117 [Chara braunii]
MNVSAREVAGIVFDRVVRYHGLPLSIISDHDPRFTRRFWRRLHEVYDTQLCFSSSYLPQTDGQTEITNRTLGDILRKIVRDDQQWDLHLAPAEIAYNHAVSPTTGMSPYYCDLSYHPHVPADFLRPSQMHPDTSCPALDDWVAHMTSITKTAHEHMAARANRSRMDHPFKVGDDVLVDARHLQLDSEADTLRKFRRRFFGPCCILQVVGSDTASSPVSFRVKLPDYLRQTRVHDVYHVSLLRPYRRLSERFARRPYERPPPIMVDSHEEFLVSDIIGRRVTDNNPRHVEYLVRWKGYPDEEATWKPLEHLQHACMLVRAYDLAYRNVEGINGHWQACHEGMLKHLQEQLKKHFTIKGTRGKNVGKGSKYWRCNYYDLRLAGTATRLRVHFLDMCNLDNVIVPLSVEERVRREAEMLDGKCLAHMLMQIEAGGAGPSNMPTASSHALEFPSSQADGADITGETATPQTTGGTALGSKPSSGRPLRQIPVGTMFWKSVCVEGKEKDSATYFRVLDDVIKEIGADAVVGVVMDNARVCVKAGKMVDPAYPTIFSVGCTVHALDLALEDMYKEMPWMAQVVDAGNKVGRFFSNVDKARASFHHYSPKTKMKRPTVTRFATNFEMLQSLKGLRKALDHCVCNKGWVDKMVRNDQLVAFHDVTTIVLDKGGFWRNLQKVLDVMQPVVELLCLVDGQGATISKVYFKMDQVVQNLHALESLSVEEHKAVKRILMGRWAFLTYELHCVAAFLDPEHRMHNAQRDSEVRVGFNIWLYL